MSDTTQEAPQDTTDTTQTPQAPVEAPEESAQATEHAEAPAQEAEKQETTDWKAEARKWEDRAKENRAAAKALDGLKAERDELAAKVSEYEAKAERTQWAQDIAAEAGVPADLIRGDTREEMAKHAEALKGFMATTSKPAGPFVAAQGKAGKPNLTDPNREAARALFGGTQN